MEHPSIPPRLSSRVRWAVASAFVCAAALIALAPGCSRSSGGGRVSRVRISEVMAANSAFPVADEAGNIVHVDWVEIHNPGSTAVSLEGYSLSDDPGNRDKFEFPRGTVLGPDGYLLVFFLNSENCRDIDCEEAVRICRAEAANDVALDACEAELVECRRDCSPPAGLVADFNVSAAGETLFLYADRGRTLIDRAGVRAQEDDVSNGLDPRTGEYGIMYVPTPRARNMPINLKGSFIDPVLVRAECDSEVLLRFKVRRDIDAPGDLEVRFEHTIVEDCKESLVGRPLESGPVTRVVPAGGDPETFDLSRKDPSGNPIVVKVVDLLYHAVLPAAQCGERRKYRFTVSDALGSSSRTASVTYGASLPTIVVNEYQPGNDRFLFEYENRDGNVVQADPPPDWLEIYNYGDKPVDIRDLALVTGGELRDEEFDEWRFGEEGGVTEPLPPGGFLWVLADQDGGTRRRSYFRLPDDGSGPYFSTHFALQADRKGAPFDEFSIVDPSTCEVIDRVVLDLSSNGFELERGRSVVRFPGVEGTEPGVLMPGTITDCPTPAGKNQMTCVVPPQFEEEVTITTPSRSHCPAAGEPVTIHARVNFDSDTRFDPDDLDELEVLATVSVETPPATFSRSPQQGGSAIVTTLYDISLEVPGQPAGTLVTFSFSARDLNLTGDAGKPVVHDAMAVTGQRTAFQYLVGYERPPGAPRLNEVLPRNRSITLPPFEGGAVKYHDFAEIYNPSSEPLDLGGYYLTTEISAADPIGLRRRWRFPEASGTIVPPGGFLPVYFGPPPASLPVDPPPEEQDPPYIQVKGFKLDSCEETLHLVAPDDPALGGNCVVDSLHWNLNLIQCASNNAVGRLCGGCESENCITELPAPTPGASNKFRPVIFHDSFHQAVVPPGDRNACVGANPTVKVDTVFFIDQKLRDVFQPASRFLSVSFIIDRGTGGPEEEVVVNQPPGGFRLCTTAAPIDCALPPAGYVNASTSILLSPPFGSIVRYRLRLVDACGTLVESEPSAFGTSAGTHPSVAINEVNRLHPVPGDETATPRPWIEIYNPSGSAVDVSGMYLSSNPANPREAPFPDGTVVPAAGVLVVPTDGASLPSHKTIDLDWTAETGTLFLLDADARGLCLLDTFPFNFEGEPNGGASIGRVPDGTGNPVLLPEPSPGSLNSSETFVRGDATGDARVNINDMVRILGILFASDTRQPGCMDALDANDDGTLNATDAVFVGNFLFRLGPLIPPPFPQRGMDPTEDSIHSCSE